jgi:hypothetical protein
MFPVLFGALKLALVAVVVAVLGRVVDCAWYVAYDPYVSSMAWTLLIPWLLL